MNKKKFRVSASFQVVPKLPISASNSVCVTSGASNSNYVFSSRELRFESFFRRLIDVVWSFKSLSASLNISSVGKCNSNWNFCATRREVTELLKACEIWNGMNETFRIAGTTTEDAKGQIKSIESRLGERRKIIQTTTTSEISGRNESRSFCSIDRKPKLSKN